MLDSTFATVSSKSLSLEIAAPYPSKKSQYGIAQAMMVLGYVVLCMNPLDGDAMMLGLICQALALTFYAMSRARAA